MSDEALLDKRRRIVGKKQTLKAILAGSAKVVYIARDAEKDVTDEDPKPLLTKGNNPQRC